MVLVYILYAATFGFAANLLYLYLTHQNSRDFSVRFISLASIGNLFFSVCLVSAANLSFDIVKILEKDMWGPIFYMLMSSLGIAVIMAFIKCGKTKEESNRKHIRIILLMLIVAFVFEFFVLNYRHFDLIGGNYEEITYNLDDEGVEISGIQRLGDGSISADKDAEGYIEITNIGKELRSIFIDVENMSREDIKIHLLMTDKSNSQYFYSPIRTLVQSQEKSRYLPMTLNGESPKFRLLFARQEEYNIKINSITFNVSRPLYFMFGRYLVIAILLMLMCYLRPGSYIYSVKYNNNSTKQRFVIAAVLAVQIWFFLFVGATSMDHINPQKDHYQTLAQQFLKGRVDLGETPPKELAELENPYDMLQRTEYYLWDTTYYKGNYYFYYGPVPAVVLYLPYLIMTQNSLPTYIAVFIFSAVAALALFGILKTLVERFFPKISFIIFLLSTVLAMNSSLIAYLLRRPKFYEVMEMGGMCFVTLGLYFWLNSIRKNTDIDREELSGETISKWRVACGSLCMALAVGCRPSLALASFLAIPVFGSYVYKNFGFEKLFNKNEQHKKLNLSSPNIKNLLFFAGPFILVASALMYYNYVRYESVFDFGIHYQLTMLDTSQFKITQWDKLFDGIVMYLFNPPDISLKFPYITESYPSNNEFMGKVAMPGYMGGAFFNLILLLQFFAPKLKYFLKDLLSHEDSKIPVRLVNSLIWIGVALITLVILMGGIMTRYMVDSMWMWIVASIIIFYAIYEYAKGSKLLYFVKRFFLFCLITGLLINFLVSLKGENNYLYVYYPKLYYKMEFMFSFWL